MKNAIPIGLNVWYVLGLVFESDTASILELKAKLVIVILLVVYRLVLVKDVFFLSGMGYVN